MHILLVTDSYPPEIRSASHLMQELAEGLRDRDYKVTVVTSYPQYNLSGETCNKRFDEFSVEDGITILRIKTLPHHMVSFAVRGISQLTMPYIFLSRIKRYFSIRFDAVIVYSPPLPLWHLGAMIKRACGAKFIFNVQDIFPQNAVDLGILKRKFLINFFRRMEEKAYDSADAVTVHSEGNRRFLLNTRQIPEDKIHILHNWIDIHSYRDASNGNLFRKKFKLQNKFIFLFAGVIGPSQGLDLIIETAGRLREIRDICFLLVGDGSEKTKLTEITESRGLKNVVFKPFVPKSDYPRLLKEADVGIVCLSSRNRTPVVPGKMLGYMAASVPVVAFLNRESDGHKIIRDARCGYSAISDNPERAVKVVRRIYNEKDRLRQYGENGNKYATYHFSRDVCIENLEKLFNGGMR